MLCRGMDGGCAEALGEAEEGGKVDKMRGTSGFHVPESTNPSLACRG